MRLFLAAVLVCAFWGIRTPDRPAELTINGHKWSVVYVPRMYDLLGMPIVGNTDCADQIIFLSLAQSAKDLADSLIHEAEHAFTCGEDGEAHDDKWNNPPGEDHPGIYWSAGQWKEFIRQNHDAIRWIQTRR